MTSAAIHRDSRPAKPPSGLLTLAEGARGMAELASFFAMRPAMSLLPRGDGHGVLVLPGFMASDSSTRPMRSLLADLGYDVAGWDLGRNLRVDNARIAAMSARLRELHERSGGKVSIVGWSLGGLFARELAKLHPEMVRQVISLGSPISPDRNHSNARHLFHAINGKTPEPQREGRFVDTGHAPPVPTTSIYTRTDGVVAWRGSLQHPELADHSRTENIEVHASHVGLGVNPSVMFVIADRLAQPEDSWRKFAPRGLAKVLFPAVRAH
ncbi:esterase/lipase family protein [Novosphingobium tardum]|uniref:Esterase/lipase family protein n=1 Tax=Novosphingobium tardum TaxID=1538021 RepID=A0ABV8RQM4_9SPHN